jgi:phasin protein
MSTTEPCKNNTLPHRTIFLSLSPGTVLCFGSARRISKGFFNDRYDSDPGSNEGNCYRSHADYAKSSCEANKSYLEQLVTLKAPDQAMQLMTDHMKTSCETFAAEAQKIGDMYKNLFNTALLPVTEAMPKLKVVS